MKALSIAAMVGALVSGCSDTEPAEKSGTVATAFDIDGEMEAALAHLKGLNRQHNDKWRLGEADSWESDQETGILRWKFADGSVVEAPFQIVGTYSHTSGTFLWAWDHPSVSPSMRKDAEAVLAYGKEHNIDFLQHRKLDCEYESVWELAALATKLCGRQGAYCGPDGTKAVFMTFGEPVIRKSP